jgi:hypothetical protein
MTNDRGDSRVSSFLVGFLVGSLLAGGTATGYFVWQERRLMAEAERSAEILAQSRAEANALRRFAEMARTVAEEERDRAEAALKKAKEE